MYENASVSDDSRGTIEELREGIDALDAELLGILSRRLGLCREIGLLKKSSGMPVYQKARWEEVLSRAVSAAPQAGLDPDFVSEVFNTIHEYSKKEQTKIIEQ